MTDDEGKNETPETPSLEDRTTKSGRLPGNRYVKLYRAPGFRRRGDRYVADEELLESASRLGRAYETVRRFLLGRRLSMEAEETERLSVFTGLAILGSDNISSSAYATEEAMRVLALAGMGAFVFLTPIAIAIVGVLAIVILSQSQVIQAYPNGGGSYIVTSDNLGTMPGLVAAAALLIDYVLTVATSTAAGVYAITSFVPDLQPDAVPIGLAFIALLMVGNLRGVREAGLIFAGPTYVYIFALGALILYGIFRIVTGDIPPAAVPPNPFPQEGEMSLAGLAGSLLVLRAFASGSVGLTGSEAIANGVPSMQKDERRHATITLVLMGATFAVLFLGLTYLAQTIGTIPDRLEAESLNSLVTRSLVGMSPFYYLVQGSTAVILALAANTGFTGFPRLASVLANDRFMPRQFAYRGDRLAFSFGIVALALASALVLAVNQGSVTKLIPFYTIGVFLAITLAQTGLVRRWRRLRSPGWQWRAMLNGLGAVVTGLVLIVVLIAKAPEGAWLIVLIIPLLVALLFSIHRTYMRTQDALVIERLDEEVPLMRAPVVIVPVGRLDRATARAVAFARSISPAVRAVHVSTSEESSREFRKRWDAWAGRVPLDVIESPYRSLVPPLLKYIDRIGERDPDKPITVVLASFVPHSWWEWLLHSQTALRLKASLLFRPNTIVIDVPYHFDEDREDHRHDR
ncbi:MAG: APC family permease [Chloroflexi bacterium]|nr:MAG: APC family permease [Chloroflexota bacterium]